jgi:hypothetical protein
MVYFVGGSRFEKGEFRKRGYRKSLFTPFSVYSKPWDQVKASSVCENRTHLRDQMAPLPVSKRGENV